MEPSAVESTLSLPLSLQESKPPTTSISSFASLPEPDTLLLSLLLLKWLKELPRLPFREFPPDAAALRDSHSARRVERSTVIPWNENISFFSSGVPVFGSFDMKIYMEIARLRWIRENEWFTSYDYEVFWLFVFFSFLNIRKCEMIFDR